MKSLRDILLAAYFYVSTGNGIFSTTEYSRPSFFESQHIFYIQKTPLHTTKQNCHKTNLRCSRRPQPPIENVRTLKKNIQNISFRTKQFFRADFVETLN